MAGPGTRRAEGVRPERGWPSGVRAGPAQVLEDISSDHALKTVTLEAHPHTSHGAGLHASIHPCKHASVMHKLCSEIMSSGREVRTDQYLFLFLKFISCVIPTIEYDHTISVDGL
jgi:ubiquitin-like-conjugating enzyme ATG3